jgi:hypothetical protein
VCVRLRAPLQERALLTSEQSGSVLANFPARLLLRGERGDKLCLPLRILVQGEEDLKCFISTLLNLYG